MLFLLESLVPKKRDSISKNNHVTVNARSFATGEKGSVCGPRTCVGGGVQMGLDSPNAESNSSTVSARWPGGRQWP